MTYYLSKTTADDRIYYTVEDMNSYKDIMEYITKHDWESSQMVTNLHLEIVASGEKEEITALQKLLAGK